MIQKLQQRLCKLKTAKLNTINQKADAEVAADVFAMSKSES